MCSDGSGDALADLERALDRVAGEDLKGRFGPQVLDRTRTLTTLKNRLDAELARTVREGELTQASEHDGAKTMQAWLRGHARYSSSAAHKLVVSGRALEHLPAVAAAFTDGRVTAEAVAALAPVAREEHRAAAAEAGVDLAAVDVVLADVAATRPFKELAQVVHHYLSNLDPDGKEPDPIEDRRLTMTRHADGSVSGRFDLDAAGGEKLQVALESMVQANRPQGDMRNRSQQQADALVQLADNLLASGTLPFLRTVKPQVVVTLDEEDLLDPHTGHGAARTGSGARISAARARMLACEGGVTRIVFGPDGQPTNLGRDFGRSAGARRELASGGGRSGPYIRRLPRPHLVVRRPPRPALARRRRNLGGERRTAVRAAPHQGPPRLPHRATTDWPMAHLPPRRHRNPHARTTTRRLTVSRSRAER